MANPTPPVVSETATAATCFTYRDAYVAINTADSVESGRILEVCDQLCVCLEHRAPNLTQRIGPIGALELVTKLGALLDTVISNV